MSKSLISLKSNVSVLSRCELVHDESVNCLYLFITKVSKGKVHITSYPNPVVVNYIHSLFNENVLSKIYYQQCSQGNHYLKVFDNDKLVLMRLVSKFNIQVYHYLTEYSNSRGLKR